MLSKEIMENKFDMAGDFFETQIKFQKCFTKPNVPDLSPILKLFDLQLADQKEYQKIFGKIGRVHSRNHQRKDSGEGKGDNRFPG